MGGQVDELAYLDLSSEVLVDLVLAGFSLLDSVLHELSHLHGCLDVISQILLSKKCRSLHCVQ